MKAGIYQHLLWVALILGVTLLTFGRLGGAGWTWWDDADTIHHNPRLNPPSWSGVGHYWRAAGPTAPMSLYIPVTYTAWSAIAAVAPQPADVDGIRLNAHAFHAVNVLLHALTAVLVFQLLRTLLRHNAAAAAGALLFALHPVQVEPVAWISGGKDVLCGLLSVAAIWQYVLWARRGGRGRYAVATLLLVLALLAKPTAVVVPVMAGVVDWLLIGRTGRQVLKSVLPWVMLALGTAVVARWSQSADWASPVPVWDRPGIAADALAVHLRNLVWPMRLSPDEGRRPALVLARGWIYYTWAAPVGVAALLLLLRRRVDRVAGLLFLLPLVPVLGLVPFEFQYVSTTAEHYLYLSMLGPALLLGAAVAGRPWTRWPVVSLLLILAALSARQAGFWQSNRSLFEHTLAMNRNSFIACDMLGFDHARQAKQLQSAARSSAAAGRFADADQSVLRSQEQLQLAIDYSHAALAINPWYVPSLLNLAIDSQRLGRTADARAAVDQIAALQPVLPRAFRAEPPDLARTLIDFGDAPAGARLLREWCRTHPDDKAARQLLERAVADPIKR